METLKYTYSKFNSIFWTVAILITILVTNSNLLKYIELHDSIIWLISAMDCFFFPVLVYVVIKQLIPALQNRIALELNSTEIISHIKNIAIKWKEIQEIEMQSSNTKSSLYITLKSRIDYPGRVRIQLQWITGDDSEIYEIVLAYFKKGRA